MRLRVLGSSGGYPAPGNPSSGFLLEHGASKLWLDAGNGTFAELQRLADFTKIDALRAQPRPRRPLRRRLSSPRGSPLRPGGGSGARIPPLRPPGVRETLAQLLMSGGAEELGRAFDFHTVDAGEAVEIAGVRLSFLRTDHPIHTLAIRAETAAGTLTYSADTGPRADLAGFASGSDLLLCEACYQDGAMGAPVHLSARQAGETARRAGARELALTHVWPTLDPRVSVEEARAAAGDLPVRWASCGEIFEIGASGAAVESFPG